MQLQGLDHIGVFAQDMEASVRFYRDALGFLLTSRQVGTRADGSHFNMAFLRQGSCAIELVDAPENFEPADGVVAHIALACDDVDKLFDELVEKGLSPEWDAPKTEGFFRLGFRHFFLRGPSGERLEFCRPL